MSETVLYNFTGTAGGSNPQTLVQYGSTAYGIAQQGGANSTGTIFSISLNSPNTFNKLYDFSSNILLGVLPISIVINSTGTILYGVAAVGGSNSSGTIFSFLTSPPYTYTKIYDLSNNGTYLETPNQLLLSGSTLYGYTTGSSITQTGSLFKININGTGYTELYSPASASPNDNKIVGLTISGSTLYFSTNYDSTSYGSIYSIPVTGGAATTLLTCLAANAVPTNLTISGSTIYFSTHTATPGSPITYANWQICSISTTGTGFQQLTSLSTAQPDGISSIVLSGNTLYAASLFGGTGTKGGLYSTSTSVSPSPTLLYSFNGTPTDGFAPYISFLYNLNLYGVTLAGGTSNIGTIFSYGPKQYNFLPRGSTITDRYNISTNGTCQIGDNSNNLLRGTLASPPGKTNTYTLAVRGNINCVGTSTDVSGASTGTYYSNSVTSFRIAADSSANRPPQSTAGYIRYNTDLSQNNIEYYNTFIPAWQQIATTTFLQNSFSTPPTIRSFLTGGSFTYTPPSGALYLKIRMVGGGGGGAGSGDTTVSTITAGSTAQATTFQSTLFIAGGGIGGTLSSINGSSAAGGTASGLGLVPIGIYNGTALTGGRGGGAAAYRTSGSTQSGGAGGSSAFGGGGGAGAGTNAPVSGGNGTAGGGGGGGGTYGSSSTTTVTGGGGGAGGYVEVYFPNPTGSYSLFVSSGGAGGVGNGLTNASVVRGGNGGAGGAGLIIIEEFYH